MCLGVQYGSWGWGGGEWWLRKQETGGVEGGPGSGGCGGGLGEGGGGKEGGGQTEDRSGTKAGSAENNGWWSSVTEYFCANPLDR